MKVLPREWKIDQLEQAFPESDWLEAEALTDRKAIQQLDQDGQVFRAKVMSGAETYPTTARLKQGKVLHDGHCPCQEFATKGYCAHWIAFAVCVRAHLNQKQNAVSSPRFDLELIGKEIPFPNLWPFIRQYAKKDKELEWQMKARFARHIASLDESKYRKLLDQVLPPSQEVRTRTPHKRFKQALQIIAILRDEAMDALALNEYKEVFLINEAVLPKLCILLRDQQEIDPPTLENFNFFIDLSRQLYTQPIPVELRDRVISWAMDLSCRSYFPNRRGHDSFYSDLIDWLSDRPNLWDECLEKLKVKYEFARKAEQLIPFLANSHALFELTGGLNEYAQFLERFKSQLEKGQRLLHFAQYHLPPKRSASLFELMARIWQGTSLERIIQEALFHVFSSMEEKEERLYWARQLLRNQFLPECYDTIVQSNENLQDNFRSWIQEQVLPELSKIRQEEYLASFYSHTGQWQELGELIKANPGRLLQRFDEQIFNQAPQKGIELYIVLIQEYLKDHHGPVASAFLGSMKRRLSEIGAYGHWKEIARSAVEEFGDRQSVIAGIFES